MASRPARKRTWFAQTPVAPRESMLGQSFLGGGDGSPRDCTHVVASSTTHRKAVASASRARQNAYLFTPPCSALLLST